MTCPLAHLAAVTTVLGCVEENVPAGSFFVVIAVCTEAVKCMTHVAVNMECGLENASLYLEFPVTLMHMIADQ